MKAFAWGALHNPFCFLEPKEEYRSPLPVADRSLMKQCETIAALQLLNLIFIL